MPENQPPEQLGRTVDHVRPPDPASVVETGVSQRKLDTAPSSSVLTGAPSIVGYVITSEIARGGMGRVYAGRDLTLDREVAIKTLLPGANPDRFLTESKITARLPHPGIPPVYALGRLDDGSPFLAMKLIRGRTLAEDLKKRTSPGEDLPRFVQVFEQIAQAVGFAHAQGILHRDLKPANVMVGEFGEVQVMDWGIAKWLAIEGELPQPRRSTNLGFGDDLAATAFGSILGTPGYMSPEQARGESVDARADVFALGSLLAAILTGKPAFVGTNVRALLDQTACGDLGDVLARLDSSAADPDLVALARQCLSAEVEKRPADARKVAEEVGKYRAGVEARLRRAETEKAEALVRETEQRKRRRFLLVSAWAVSTVLLLGVIGTTTGLVMAMRAADREREARTTAENEFIRAEGNYHRAEANFQRAEGNLKLARKAVDDCFVVATEDPALQGEHQLAVRKLLLERALPFYEGFNEQQSDEPSLLRTTANNWSKIALAREKLGRNSDALVAHDRAIATLRQLMKVETDARHSNVLAQMLANKASCLDNQGELDKALTEYREAQSLLDERLQKAPDDPTNQYDLVQTLVNLGPNRHQAGQIREAHAVYDQARVLLEKLTEHDPKSEKYRSAQIACLHNLGNLHRQQREVKKALEYFDQCQRLVDRHIATSSTDLRALTLAAGVNNLRGICLRELGKLEEALKSFEVSTRYKVRLTALYPQMHRFRYELAVSDLNLGGLYQERGDYPLAQTKLERAVETLASLIEAHPGQIEYELAGMAANINLGRVLSHGGQGDRELACYDRAIQLATSAAKRAPKHPMVLQGLPQAYSDRARVFVRRGKKEEALEAWNLALRAASKDWRVIVVPGRAAAFARVGKIAEAMEQIGSLDPQVRALPANAADLAIAHALAVPQFANDAKLREAHAAMAVWYLGRGVPELPVKRREYAEFLRTTKELDSLRKRDDFAKVLAEVSKSDSQKQ